MKLTSDTNPSPKSPTENLERAISSSPTGQDTSTLSTSPLYTIPSTSYLSFHPYLLPPSIRPRSLGDRLELDRLISSWRTNLLLGPKLSDTSRFHFGLYSLGRVSCRLHQICLQRGCTRRFEKLGGKSQGLLCFCQRALLRTEGRFCGSEMGCWMQATWGETRMVKFGSNT